MLRDPNNQITLLDEKDIGESDSHFSDLKTDFYFTYHFFVHHKYTKLMKDKLVAIDYSKLTNT